MRKSLLLVTLVWFLSTVSVSSDESIETAIDGVEFRQQDSCYWIEVNFDGPIHYLSHFPYSAGDAVRINIKRINDTQLLKPRSSIAEHPGFHPQPPFTLTDIDFRSGVVELRFSQSTPFVIWQGDDFRSLVISVPGPDGNQPCSIQD